MNSIIHLSAEQLLKAADIKVKIASLQNQLNKILGNASMSPDGAPKKKRKMSKAGRARIAAAQKARWAKFNGKKKAGSPVKRAKRKMSAKARAKIAAAAKARWAKAKAAGRRRL